MEKFKTEELKGRYKQKDYLGQQVEESSHKIISGINGSMERMYQLGRASVFAVFYEFASNGYDLDSIIIGMDGMLKENPDVAKDVYAIRKEIEGNFKKVKGMDVESANSRIKGGIK